MSNSYVLLLVDDDEDDRALFQEAVLHVNQSLKCLTAVDGLDALRSLEKANTLPNLIFLDLNMPRMGGKECLTAIKKEPRFAHIPIVIYSTSKIPEDVEEVLRLGASDYFKKPILFEEIADLIGRAIELHLPKKVRKLAH